MTQNNLKYTNLRSKTYWLHYRLPSALYNGSTLSSPLIRCSLNTEDAAKAATLAPLLVLKVKEFCSQKTNTLLTNESIKHFIDSTLIALGEKSRPLPKAQLPQIPKLSEAFNEYKAEALRANRWRTQTEYENSICNKCQQQSKSDPQQQLKSDPLFLGFLH